MCIRDRSIAYCEILTSLYGKEFDGLEVETNMLQEADFLKVLDYSKTNARVFYKNSYNSNVLEFENHNGIWKIKRWDTIWSKEGSADKFLWPYIR